MFIYFVSSYYNYNRIVYSSDYPNEVIYNSSKSWFVEQVIAYINKNDIIFMIKIVMLLFLLFIYVNSYLDANKIKYAVDVGNQYYYKDR